MIDDIRKKQDKGTRKLEQFLKERGYVIVKLDKSRRHHTITVKRKEEVNDPNAESVKTTLSHRVHGKGDSQSRMKMVLREIENLFSGRRRRGQGEFKLSEDSLTENWFGVLKIQGLSKSIKALVDRIMSDGEIRSSDEIRDELEKHYASRKGDNTKRKRGTGAYIPSPGSIKYYMSRSKSKYEQLNKYEYKWRGSNG